MSDFYIFKVKSPRLSGSNIRISNRTPGLSPMGPIEVEGPTPIAIAITYLLSIPLLVLGIFFVVAISSKSIFGGVLIAVAFILPGLWRPIRITKEWYDAKRINAWQPELLEPVIFERQGESNDLILLERTLVPVPTKKDIASSVLIGTLLVAVGIYIASTLMDGRAGAFLSGIPFFGIFILFGLGLPIRTIKKRYDAIRINAWQPELADRPRMQPSDKTRSIMSPKDRFAVEVNSKTVVSDV